MVYYITSKRSPKKHQKGEGNFLEVLRLHTGLPANIQSQSLLSDLDTFVLEQCNELFSVNLKSEQLVSGNLYPVVVPWNTSSFRLLLPFFEDDFEQHVVHFWAQSGSMEFYRRSSILF